jgi:hypothetical protein
MPSPGVTRLHLPVVAVIVIGRFLASSFCWDVSSMATRAGLLIAGGRRSRFPLGVGPATG